MNPLIINIDESLISIEHELVYILQLLFKNYNLKVIFSKAGNYSSDLTISENENTAIAVNKYNFIEAANLSFSNDFDKAGFCKLNNGKIDYLSTAFYLVSSAQEFKNATFDKYGRFPYSVSYQKHFDVTNKNRVQYCFDEIVRTNHQLSSLKKTNSRSKIFLSHDVDFINGALIQDGFFALKKLNIQAIFKVLFQNLFHKPQWLNMDDIMKIENENERNLMKMKMHFVTII
jgi:hypothetical protein